MTSDEEWNVVQRVLVGDGQYREYRLTEALNMTDRTPLWCSTQDVVNGINDIIVDKTSEISELKRRIKLLEKSKANWVSLAKVVNKKNEKFFFNVVKASKEDIERFELQNFHSEHGWSKIRNVSELDEDQKMKLFDTECCDVVSAMRISNKDYSSKENSNNSAHYEWVCKKICESTTSQGNGVGERCCEAPKTVCVSVTGSNDRDETQTSDVAGDNDPLPNTPPPVETSETVFECITNAESQPNSSIDQDLKDTPLTQITVSLEHSVKHHRDSTAIGEKLDDEKISVEDACKDSRELKERPEDTAECHSDNVDENTAAGEKENQSSLKIGTCSEGDSRPVPSPVQTVFAVSQLTESLSSPADECSKNHDENRKDFKPINEKRNQDVIKPQKKLDTTVLASRPKDPIADLRLVSSSSSTASLPIVSISQSKVTGNIWEQKAQQRKLEEEQKAMLKKKDPVEEKISHCSNNWNESYGTTTQGERNPDDENNGWVCVSSNKRSDPTNGSFSNKKETIENVPIPVVGQLDEQCVMTNHKTDSKESELSNEIGSSSKAENTKETEEFQEEDGIDKQKNDNVSKTEKRKKKRQKFHETRKAESKKQKEKNRDEHDLKIKEAKEEKQRKQKEEYDRNQLEQDNFRRTEEANRIRNKLVSDTNKRLNKHLQEINLEDQIKRSKTFINLRLPILEKDKEVDISLKEFSILNKFKKQIAGLEKNSEFLTFVAHQLGDNGEFKMKGYLEYMTSCLEDGEPQTPLQKKIHQASTEFRTQTKFKTSDAMNHSLKLVEKVIKTLKTMNETDDVLYVEKILTDYKNQYNEVVEFIGITSYLSTRIQEDLFSVEEDYLVMKFHKEECGSQGLEVDPVSDEKEDFEKAQLQAMSCQTKGNSKP